jgi:hypothetical protein
VIVPHAAPPHPKPVTFHVTAVLLLPVTVALNNCCALMFNVTAIGDTATLTLVAEMIVTAADADIDGLDNNVAVTATVLGIGGVGGAVYKPVEVIMPQVMPAQPLPETLQFTTLEELPLVTAANCICPPGFT